mmetsp:Transcript_33586/g.61834  ORF Transcript_33586/g.61834 Transcript_33586/m.61834 type:complete len:215 (+) Transcript_33586:758-1402(+)
MPHCKCIHRWKFSRRRVSQQVPIEKIQQSPPQFGLHRLDMPVCIRANDHATVFVQLSHSFPIIHAGLGTEEIVPAAKQEHRRDARHVFELDEMTLIVPKRFGPEGVGKSISKPFQRFRIRYQVQRIRLIQGRMPVRLPKSRSRPMKEGKHGFQHPERLAHQVHNQMTPSKNKLHVRRASLPPEHDGIQVGSGHYGGNGLERGNLLPHGGQCTQA